MCKVYKEHIDRERFENLEQQRNEFSKKLDLFRDTMHNNGTKLAEIAGNLENIKNETELYKNLFEIQKIAISLITECIK